MSGGCEQQLPEQQYRIRAVHRDVPDPERLVTLIVNLTTARRDQDTGQKNGGTQEKLPRPDSFR